jgi:hypothetical protein
VSDDLLPITEDYAQNVATSFIQQTAESGGVSGDSTDRTQDVVRAALLLQEASIKGAASKKHGLDGRTSQRVARALRIQASVLENLAVLPHSKTRLYTEGLDVPSVVATSVCGSVDERLRALQLIDGMERINPVWSGVLRDALTREKMLVETEPRAAALALSLIREKEPLGEELTSDVLLSAVFRNASWAYTPTGRYGWTKRHPLIVPLRILRKKKPHQLVRRMFGLFAEDRGRVEVLSLFCEYGMSKAGKEGVRGLTSCFRETLPVLRSKDGQGVAICDMAVLAIYMAHGIDPVREGGMCRMGGHETRFHRGSYIPLGFESDASRKKAIRKAEAIVGDTSSTTQLYTGRRRDIDVKLRGQGLFAAPGSLSPPGTVRIIDGPGEGGPPLVVPPE